MKRAVLEVSNGRCRFVVTGRRAKLIILASRLRDGSSYGIGSAKILVQENNNWN